MSHDKFAPHAIAGMAMAAFELQRRQIVLMHEAGLLKKQQMHEMVDLALQQVEEYRSTGNKYLEEPAGAARHLLMELLVQCQRLRD